ncbi:DUF397 domain-containing protein [Actinoplanes sp. NPDC023714]|uniref:DUF397 domain-containing protein n=1 Tax=Actinoplanes sp. NPDC023714 TaxID=3154322 RepID=UPI0033F03043
MRDRAESGWFKSSHSESGGCVEVKMAGDVVLVRDTKDRSGPVLSFDRAVFQAFVDDLKDGDPFTG